MASGRDEATKLAAEYFRQLGETGETAGGTATSKKQAEQGAAAALLAQLGLNGDNG